MTGYILCCTSDIGASPIKMSQFSNDHVVGIPQNHFNPYARLC